MIAFLGIESNLLLSRLNSIAKQHFGGMAFQHAIHIE
jgi:hypothetical protein